MTARVERVLQGRLKNGVSCVASDVDASAGETHHCFFAPTSVRGHDFANRNERAGYVVTELGPNCDEIEILSDREYQPGDGAAPLRRVGVACTR